MLIALDHLTDGHINSEEGFGNVDPDHRHNPSGNVAPDLRVMASYIWRFYYILVETSMQREPFRKFCVIGCLRCGLLQVVRTDRKTRRCPGCGYVNQLDFSRIKVWFKTDKTSEAVYALQRLKMMQKTGKLK